MASAKPSVLKHTGKPAVRARSRAGTNTITMADVASMAGVSAQTVSRVLRHPNGSAPHIRERVLEAVRATNYVQNLAASGLASNRSKSIAAVIPVLSASIFAQTVQGISNVLTPADYQIVIGHTDYQQDREESVVRSLLGRRPDAFFLVGTRHTKATRTMLIQAGIPVVETWGWTSSPIDQLVGFSNQQAFVDMIGYLKSAGYQYPVFAGVIRSGDDRAQGRLKGYVEGMKKYYPDRTPHSIVVADLPYQISSGRILLRLAREQCRDYGDVLMFSSDLFASGALLACQELGISVPKDLAITGFGNYDIAQELRPALTTVAVPSTQMGEDAARIMLERINAAHGAVAGLAALRPKKIPVQYELLLRASA